MKTDGIPPKYVKPIPKMAASALREDSHKGRLITVADLGEHYSDRDFGQVRRLMDGKIKPGTDALNPHPVKKRPTRMNSYVPPLAAHNIADILPGFSVIECATGCIVPYRSSTEESSRYVVLSYVWGQLGDDKETKTASQPSTLTQLPEDVLAVVCDESGQINFLFRTLPM